MRTCLLIIMPAYLFIGVESEVLQNYDFGECKQFFFEGSPPKGLDKDGGANIYVPICQKTYDIPRYATYYDTGTKMPIFSAYKSESLGWADTERPPTYSFIEPELCAPQISRFRPSMQDEDEDCGIPNSFADQKQAMKLDYLENWWNNYDMGPLNPESHHTRNESKLATFNLTNAAPLSYRFISETWNKVEQEISAVINSACPKRPLQTCEAYHITGTGFDSGPRHKFSSIRGFFNSPHFVWTAVCVRFFPNHKSNGGANFMRFGVIGWNSEEVEGEYLEVYPLEEFEIRLKLLLHSEDVEMFPANSQWIGCNLRDDSESIFQELERSRIAFDYTFLLRRRLAELLPQHRSDISTSAAQPGFSGGYVVDHPIIAGQFSVGPLTISAPSSSWATGVGRLLEQLKLTCDVRETGPGEMRSANQDTARTVCTGLTPRCGRTRAARGDLCRFGTQCRKDSSDGIYKCYAGTNGQTLPCCAPDSPCGKGNAVDGYYDYNWCWTSDKHKGREWAHCSPPYSSMTVGQSMARCPEGWVKSCLEPGLLSCYCYKKVLVPKTWEAATQSCREEEGYLISLESQKEELVLLHIANGTEMVMNPSPIGLADRIQEKRCKSICPRFWIGLGDHNKAWSHGAPMNYTNWASGRDTRGVMDCTYFSSMFGRWYPKSCTIPTYYVCKKPADIPRHRCI